MLGPGRGFVVGGGDGEVGAVDGSPRELETGEGLWRGDLVDEVHVDEKKVRLAGGAGYDVAVPDLLGQGFRHRTNIAVRCPRAPWLAYEQRGFCLVPVDSLHIT